MAGGNEPFVKSIKLAWWRERLDELGSRPPPPEPILQSAARELLPSGVTGARLAVMTEGWDVLASAETLGPGELAVYAERRGGGLFRLSAQLLGVVDADAVVDAAGRGWALIDLARHSSDEGEASRALVAAAECLAGDGARIWPQQLRSLGMLGALARRDSSANPASFERQGSPLRMFRMLHHHLTGR